MKSFRVCEEMLDMLVQLQWDIEDLIKQEDCILDNEFYDKEEYKAFVKFLIVNAWYPECINIHDVKKQYLLHGEIYQLYRRYERLESDMCMINEIMYSASFPGYNTYPDCFDAYGF